MNIAIGQRILINGTNAERKKKEGIPMKTPAELYSISSAPGRPTLYNVVASNGEKYGLQQKEFKLLDPILPCADTTSRAPDVVEEEEGVSSSKVEEPEEE